MDKGQKPATRNDVAKVGGKILGKMDHGFERLNAKIDGVHQGLDAKIDGVEQRLDAKIDGAVHRIAVRLVTVETSVKDSHRKVDEVLSRMMTSEQFTTSMDRYVARMEVLERSLTIRHDLWRDHGRRISELERNQRPTG